MALAGLMEDEERSLYQVILDWIVDQSC